MRYAIAIGRSERRFDLNQCDIGIRRRLLRLLDELGTQIMMVTHIFADWRGDTHFADVEIPMALTPVAAHLPPMQTSPPFASIRTRFVVVPPAVIARDWHPAPARQFVLLLKGQLEVEVADGERRLFAPGAVVFLEDTEGKGHKDHAVDDDELLLVLIPVTDEVAFERLADG